MCNGRSSPLADRGGLRQPERWRRGRSPRRAFSGDDRSMATNSTSPRGAVAALWRYPVKSMRGEELDSSEVTDPGLLGARAYALVDFETGKVVSAKNPRKWPNMLEFRSAFVEPPHSPGAMPPARITTPDGATIETGDSNFDARISALVGRPVRLSSSAG